MEPGLAKALVAKNHELEDFFDLKEMEFEAKDGENVINEVQPTILCRDIIELMNYVAKERDSSHDYLTMISCDNGGGFLKFGLNMVESEEMKSPQNAVSFISVPLWTLLSHDPLLDL